MDIEEFIKSFEDRRTQLECSEEQEDEVSFDDTDDEQEADYDSSEDEEEKDEGSDEDFDVDTFLSSMMKDEGADVDENSDDDDSDDKEGDDDDEDSDSITDSVSAEEENDSEGTGDLEDAYGSLDDSEDAAAVVEKLKKIEEKARSKQKKKVEKSESQVDTKTRSEIEAERLFAEIEAANESEKKKAAQATVAPEMAISSMPSEVIADEHVTKFVEESLQSFNIAIKTDRLRGFVADKARFQYMMYTLALNYGLSRETGLWREILTEFVKNGAHNSAGVRNELFFDPGNQKVRVTTVRDILLSYYNKNGYAPPPPLSYEDWRLKQGETTDADIRAHLGLEKDDEITDQMRAQIERSRVERKEEAAAMAEELKKVDTMVNERRKVEAGELLRDALVTPIELCKVVPRVFTECEESVKEATASFLYCRPHGRGTNNLTCLTIDNRTSAMIYPTRLSFLPLMQGRIPPVLRHKNKEDEIVALQSYVCASALGKKFTEKFKKVGKEQSAALDALAEMLYYGDDTESLRKAFRAAFEYDVPAEWFNTTPNKLFGENGIDVPSREATLKKLPKTKFLVTEEFIGNLPDIGTFVAAPTLEPLAVKKAKRKRSTSAAGKQSNKKQSVETTPTETTTKKTPQEAEATNQPEKETVSVERSTETKKAKKKATSKKKSEKRAEKPVETPPKVETNEAEPVEKAVVAPKVVKDKFPVIQQKRKRPIAGKRAQERIASINKLKTQLSIDPPVSKTVEPRSFPSFFFCEPAVAPSEEYDAQNDAFDVLKQQLHEKVPNYSKELAVQAYSVATQDHNTTSAQKMQARIVDKESDEPDGMSEDDEIVDDFDDDVAGTADVSTDNADDSDLSSVGKKLSEDDWRRIDEVSHMTGIERQKIDHLFLQQKDAKMARDIEADNSAQLLLLSEAEKAVLYTTFGYLRKRYAGKAKTMDRSQTTTKSRVTNQSARTPTRRPNNLTQLSSVDKLGTTRDGTVTKEELEQRASDAKCPLAESSSPKTWLEMRMKVEALGVPTAESAPSIELLSKLLVAIAEEDKYDISVDHRSKVLLLQSQMHTHIVWMIDVLCRRHHLLRSDLNTNNLPLLGRFIGKDGEGFDTYMAMCVLLNDQIAELAELCRQERPSSESVKACIQKFTELFGKDKDDFSPVQRWSSEEPIDGRFGDKKSCESIVDMLAKTIAEVKVQ